MRKIAIAMLATGAIMMPGFGAMAQNAPAPHPQTQNQQPPTQNAQPQTSQSQQPQANGSGNSNQQAQSETISPRHLSRDKVRQVQTALNNNGDNVGRVDGRWGRETRHALRKFQQSKGIQSNGKLDQQTVADLGLNMDQLNQGKKSRGS